MLQPTGGLFRRLQKKEPRMLLEHFMPLQDEIQFLCAPINWDNTSSYHAKKMWQRFIQHNESPFNFLDALYKLSEAELRSSSSYDYIPQNNIRVANHEIERQQVKFLLHNNEDGLSLYEMALIKNCDVVELTRLINNMLFDKAYYCTCQDQGKLGLSPLKIAIFFKRKEVVRLIIQALLESFKYHRQEETIKAILNDATASGWNLLMLAFFYNIMPQNLITYFRLLSVDNRIEILKKQNKEGNNILMLDARYHPEWLQVRIANLKVLLHGRSDYLETLLKAKNKDNQTVFDLLSEQPDEHMCHLLKAIMDDFPDIDTSILKPELVSKYSFLSGSEKMPEPAPPKKIGSGDGETDSRGCPLI